MYVADLKRALDLLGDKLAQLYGQGESPMTITHLSREMHADRSPSALGAAPGFGRPARLLRGGEGGRRGRPASCRWARSARSSSRAIP